MSREPRAKKSLGQHFMTDAADLEAVGSAAAAGENERVLEIGPGPGALTAVLLRKGYHVVALEKDGVLADRLPKKFPGASLEVILTDVLEWDPSSKFSPQERAVVFGNIPYNITSPILFWLIRHRSLFREAALTVQFEVAERLTGRPGIKLWGALSVSVGAYAEARFLRKIPRGHFRPAPKVDSALVHLRFLDAPRYAPGQGEIFHLLVAKAFQKRRKTLLNALTEAGPDLTRERLLGCITQADLVPTQRPETLSVEQWVALSDRVSRSQKI